MAVLNKLKIKELREARGLKMIEAAKLAGITSAQKWNDLENGKKRQNVTLETLTKLARALKCSVTDLIKE